jgi:hypothetical protein
VGEYAAETANSGIAGHRSPRARRPGRHRRGPTGLHSEAGSAARRRSVTGIAALACLAAAALRAAPDAAAAAERPNVVLVLTDDQRWDTLGANAHRDELSLDRRVREQRAARRPDWFERCSPSTPP